LRTAKWVRGPEALEHHDACRGVTVPRDDAANQPWTGFGAFTTADRAGEPPIVPPGWTFTIWSVIIALSIGYAIWADSDRRPDAELRARLTLPLLVTCVGFSVWLAAAELEPNWTTLVIFLIMLAALLRALMYAMDQRPAIRVWSPLARVLLWGPFGLYTGWSSVAVWLNLTTGR